MTTGEPSSSSPKTEIIDVLNDTAICDRLSDMPSSSFGGIGGAITENLLLLCFGTGPNSGQCLSLTDNVLVDMKYLRYYMTGIVIGDKVSNFHEKISFYFVGRNE